MSVAGEATIPEEGDQRGGCRGSFDWRPSAGQGTKKMSKIKQAFGLLRRIASISSRDNTTGT